MSIFAIASILIVVSALFGYVNTRFLKLPNTIGLMLITIVVTLLVLASSYFNDTLLEQEKLLLSQIDFQSVLLDVMLSFLLFAGALHTNFNQLKVQRYPILVFASLGTITSTFIVGAFSFYLFKFLGLDVAFIHCLLFGALISPTDPIAVLGILKQVGAPKKLETKIVGESLFNDGVGVVIFLTIYQIAKGGTAITFGHVAELFLVEVIGGITLGLILGWITYKMLKSIDDYDTEVIITIATVMGGTILAQYLHVSAPLAMVVAGLLIGHKIHINEDKSPVQKAFNSFWEILDDVFNGILFVLIGLAIHLLAFNTSYIILGILAIVIVLLARFISVLLPYSLLKHEEEKPMKTIAILTWGGLRGGISIALALSLSKELSGDLILHITYIIVLFSIIVQGLSIGKIVKKLYK